MKPLALIVALLALAATFVLALSARQGSTTGVESQANLVRASEQSHGSGVQREVPTLVPPTTGARIVEETSEERPAATPPSNVGSTTTPDAPVDASDFTWKYKGYTMSQLDAAYLVVSSALGMGHWHAMKRAVADGKGELIGRDEIGFTGVAPRDTVDGAFYSEVRQSFVKVRMSRQEAPEVLAMRDELFWISGRLEQIQEEHHERQVEAATREYERER